MNFYIASGSERSNRCGKSIIARHAGLFFDNGSIGSDSSYSMAKADAACAYRQDRLATGLRLGILLGISTMALTIASPVLAQDAVCVNPATGAPYPAQVAAAAAAAGSQLMCGNGAIATGNGAVAVGPQATAEGDEALAFGTQSEAKSINTIAIGSEARALNTNALAIGRESTATGEYSLAIGSGASVSGNLGISIGNNTTAGQFDVSVGSGALQNATGSEATVAIGFAAGQVAAGVERSVFVGSFSGVQSSGQQNVFGGRFTGAAVTGSNNVAQGTAAGAATTGDNNVSIGNQAGTRVTLDASGNPASVAPSAFSNAVNIGTGAAGLADNAVAIGEGSVAAERSIAIGTEAQATGAQAISIGTRNIVSGNNSGAFGDPNIVDGSGSYAFGNDNLIAADNAFVLGNGVTIASGLDGAVALGNGSTVEAAVGTSSVIISGNSYLFAGTAPAATVSVGAAGAERTITHVAAGRISGTSTDAINGSQFYATNQQVTLNSALIGTQGQTIANALGGSSSYDASTGTVTAALTVGGNSYSNVNDALGAINGVASAGWNIQANGGPASNVPANGLLDVAAGSNVAVTLSGNRLEVAVVDAPTFSGTVTANGGLAVASGQTVNMGNNVIQNVAAGQLSTTSTDAVNGSQLHATNQQVALNSALIGTQGQTIANALGGSSSYDASTGTVTATLTVGGNSYNNVNDAINAIGSVASAGWNIQANGGPASNVPANGTLNVVSGSNVAVNLSGNRLEVAVVDAPTFSGMVTANGGLTVAAGQTVNMGGNVVRNVGAGELSATSSDAVNGSQLHAVQQVANNSVQYDAGRNSVTFNPGGSATVLHNVAPGVAPTDAVNVAQLNAGLDQTLTKAQQYTDQQLANIGANFGTIHRDLRAGTAGALAAAALPQAFEPGKGMLAFGAGTYGGEQAFAIGLSRVMDDARTVLKAGGSFNTRSKAGANIGVGFQF